MKLVEQFLIYIILSREKREMTALILPTKIIYENEATKYERIT